MFEDKTTAALKAQVLSEIDPTVGISTMAGSYADAVAGPLCRQVSEFYKTLPGVLSMLFVTLAAAFSWTWWAGTTST